MNLVAATILLLFSAGRWVIPLATWLSPIFLLRFVRAGRPLPRLAIAGVVVYLVGCLTWRGMVPVSGPAYFVIMLAIMLPSLLPYLAGLFVPRNEAGFGTTLLFPSAWVLTEYLISLTSPYGTWGLTAYTQVDQLPLIQSVAVTGLWGIGFLVAWTAAVANWAWERHFEWRRVRGGVLIWGGVLAFVSMLGGARLVFAPPGGPTVRVASFTIPLSEKIDTGDLLHRRRAGAGLDSVRADLSEHHATLFAAVRREAAAGARLVAWSETGALVLKDEQKAFEREAADVAREARVHLILGLAVFTPGTGFYENILLAVDSTGAKLASYHKARPVPGDRERGADQAIPVFETSLGRIAGAICFDGDFLDVMGKAGRERAGLLVIPSSDWRAIDPMHTRMALLRGVENGCSVVRPTNKGLSAAADWQGRILASTDFFRTRPSVMVAQVPVRGVHTLYSRFPDFLPLVCGIVFASSMVRGLLRRRRG